MWKIIYLMLKFIPLNFKKGCKIQISLFSSYQTPKTFSLSSQDKNALNFYANLKRKIEAWETFSSFQRFPQCVKVLKLNLYIVVDSSNVFKKIFFYVDKKKKYSQQEYAYKHFFLFFLPARSLEFGVDAVSYFSP